MEERWGTKRREGEKWEVRRVGRKGVRWRKHGGRTVRLAA